VGFRLHRISDAGRVEQAIEHGCERGEVGFSG